MTDFVQILRKLVTVLLISGHRNSAAKALPTWWIGARKQKTSPVSRCLTAFGRISLMVVDTS